MSDASRDPVPPPRQAAPRGGFLFGGMFMMSVLANLFLVSVFTILVIAGIMVALAGGSDKLTERLYAGETSAKDKIAIVQVDGIILEGMIGYARKQIREAGKDDAVEAVVLRIDSPGGSITASDELHHLITELRDGNPEKSIQPKPVVVSMGGLAASGGYYIAMPGKPIFAERTTMTGSIGVYAAFPNLVGLTEKIGVTMQVIKRGEVKTAGSPFGQMTPQERQVWEDSIDHAYSQFLAVVEQGRPQLKGKLREVVVDRQITTDKGAVVPYQRLRADGGVFSADQAKEFGLIDKVGYLEDAVQAAKTAAALGTDYKVVTYERPATLFGSLLGVQSTSPTASLDAGRLAEGVSPRIWYLTPQSEVAGILAASR